MDLIVNEIMDVVDVVEVQPTCHTLEIVELEEIAPTCHQ
jgi:hypothetical protein